jgi:8-oxo-dGTP pyrophosphatase MutT (NUDIX family)
MKMFGAVNIGVAAQQLIGKRYEVVFRHGRAITPGSSSESLHALRIQCKRLRYLFEFYYPIYGETLKPEIKKLRKLQDVLGEFQDASVATQQLRQYVESVPKRTRKRDRSIASGHLISGQNRQAAIRGADLPQAWNRFDREGGRKAVIASLREPVDSRHVDERAQDLKRMSKGRPPKPERIRQACVIPFRRLRSGTMFCLITSLNKRRWIFPKGCVDGDESVQETALKEAFEEAGLYGRVIVPPLGRYVDSKWGAILDVTVMLMEVERIDDVWQEDMRVRCWTDGKEALRLLARPELRKMLRRGIRRLSGARGPISQGTA